MRQFQEAVGEQLGKMRLFLSALEGSLDREAERVRSEAGVALRKELGSLNSYLEQLRQMEKVLEEVADKPQTEFLMVSSGDFPLLPLGRDPGHGELIPGSGRGPEVQRGPGTRQGHTGRRGAPRAAVCCVGWALHKAAMSKGDLSHNRRCGFVYFSGQSSATKCCFLRKGSLF